MKKFWKAFSKCLDTALLVHKYIPILKREVDALSGELRTFVTQLLAIWQE